MHVHSLDVFRIFSKVIYNREPYTGFPVINLYNISKKLLNKPTSDSSAYIMVK